jgi:TRAP-type C4-dicarboxylate transport system substrate-binding protein
MTRQLTGILTAILVATAACGKGAEQQQAEETAKTIAEATKSGADQMAAGAAAMAKGLEQMSKATANVEVVPFETLGAAFPEVSGWTRGEVTGTTTNMPMKMSQSRTD